MALSVVKSNVEKNQAPDFVKGKKQRHPPLRTAGDCRREISRLYWAAKHGSIDVSDASKLGNLLGILGRMVQTEGLEERISSLESEVSSR